MVLNKRPEMLTAEYVLSKVSEYSVYRYYIGNDIKIGVSFCSVFRKDQNPSMAIYMAQDGRLRYVDYADDRYKGSCIDMVMQLYQLTYPQAVQKIAHDMGIANSSTEYKRIVSEYTEPVIDRRRNSFIQIQARKWSSRDEKWWGQYGITREQLQADNVYPLKECYVNRRRHQIGATELAYGYYYPEGIKIYMPERQKNEKWLSSITTRTVEGLDKLNGHKKVVILKSKKDRLTMANILPPEIGLISVQNESVSAYTDSLIEILQGRDVWISYDSDQPGKAASLRVNERYPMWKHVNVPDTLAPIKDWGEMIVAVGKEPIIEHYKKKQII